MDLKDFVETTLRQIVDGVAAAQKYAAENGAAVNPSFSASSASVDHLMGYTASDHTVWKIEFDVAVTAKDQASAKGGGDVQVAGLFRVGGGASTSTGSESVSRLRFVVPVTLPVDSATAEEMAERQRKQTEQMSSPRSRRI